LSLCVTTIDGTLPGGESVLIDVVLVIVSDAASGNTHGSKFDGVHDQHDPDPEPEPEPDPDPDPEPEPEPEPDPDPESEPAAPSIIIMPGPSVLDAPFGWKPQPTSTTSPAMILTWINCNGDPRSKRCRSNSACASRPVE